MLEPDRRCMIAEPDDRAVPAGQVAPPDLLGDADVLLLSSHTDAGYATQPLHDQPARAGCLLNDRVFDVPVLVDAPWRFAKGASCADR
jgi:hypothetical protein